MADKDDYQQHIHVFRGVAIIMIVCAHTYPSLNWSGSPELGRLIDTVVNQTSIFFFFIAGYLFQHLSERFSYSRYLRQKAKTVVLPYLLLSIPALLVFTLMIKRVGMWWWFYDLPIWQQIGLFLLTGKHLAPLWFVPTITMFYLAAPLFLWIDRKWPQGYWLIVPLLALSTYVGRGGQLGPLNFAMYLLPVYLLGMAFSHDKERALGLVQRWWPVLVGLSVLCVVGEVYEWASPPFRQMPFKASLTLLFTWLLWRHHRVFGKRLDYIAEVSFGIFFIHAYYISAIKMLTVYVLEGRIYLGEGAEAITGNVVNYLLYVGVVLTLTVATLWGAKALLGSRSRMFVGA